MPIACTVNTVRALPGVAIVAVQGSIDPISLDSFRKTLEALRAKGVRSVVLNLEAVRYVNSAGMSYLVQVSDQLNARGGVLLLANPQPKVKVVFDLMGVGQFFRLHRTVGAALVSIAEARKKRRLKRQA